jgi:hypothetical protein
MAEISGGFTQSSTIGSGFLRLQMWKNRSGKFPVKRFIPQSSTDPTTTYYLSTSLFKQWGEWGPGSGVHKIDGLKFRTKPVDLGGEVMIKAGKGMTGRTLDGIEWNQYPI